MKIGLLSEETGNTYLYNVENGMISDSV